MGAHEQLTVLSGLSRHDITSDVMTTVICMYYFGSMFS